MALIADVEFGLSFAFGGDTCHIGVSDHKFLREEQQIREPAEREEAFVEAVARKCCLHLHSNQHYKNSALSKTRRIETDDVYSSGGASCREEIRGGWEGQGYLRTKSSDWAGEVFWVVDIGGCALLCFLYTSRAAGLAMIRAMSSCLLAFAGTETEALASRSLSSTTLRDLLGVDEVVLDYEEENLYSQL